jgi:hypothetical protein
MGITSPASIIFVNLKRSQNLSKGHSPRSSVNKHEPLQRLRRVDASFLQFCFKL